MRDICDPWKGWRGFSSLVASKSTWHTWTPLLASWRGICMRAHSWCEKGMWGQAGLSWARFRKITHVRTFWPALRSLWRKLILVQDGWWERSKVHSLFPEEGRNVLLDSQGTDLDLILSIAILLINWFINSSFKFQLVLFILNYWPLAERKIVKCGSV